MWGSSTHGVDGETFFFIKISCDNISPEVFPCLSGFIFPEKLFLLSLCLSEKKIRLQLLLPGRSKIKIYNETNFLHFPRFYSLWDTGYAKIHIPIIASVSEHQPTTWFSFFFDLHILVATFPAGLWYCIKEVDDSRVFSGLQGEFASNFFPLLISEYMKVSMSSLQL